MADAQFEIENEPQQAPRKGFALFRDLLRFQIKLALDGLRDLVLSPLSIGATLWGLIRHPNRPDHYFVKLMAIGRRSDRWINLFGEFDDLDKISSDDYIQKLEALLLEGSEKNAITKELRQNAEELLERIQTRRKRRPES